MLELDGCLPSIDVDVFFVFGFLFWGPFFSCLTSKSVKSLDSPLQAFGFLNILMYLKCRSRASSTALIMRLVAKPLLSNQAL